MSLFFLLLGKLLPLYLLAGSGFIAGKFCKVERSSIAYILFYILSPIVVFHGAYSAGLSFRSLLLPTYFFTAAAIIAGFAYFIGKTYWRDGTENILAVGSASSNTGYFGIPVTIAILGEQALPIVVVATMGLVIFECTVGYFLTARGAYSVRDSIKKLFTVPATYAFILGVMMHALGWTPGEWYASLIDNVKGSYGVLGTMLIGLGAVGGLKIFDDVRFITFACIAKVAVWPLVMWGIITLDTQFLHALTPLMKSVMVILSFMPMAANTIVLATTLNVKPERAAAGVLATSLLSFLTIPLAVTLLGVG